MRPPERPIFLCAPIIDEVTISAVVQCLRSRWIGPGARVEEFEHEFARYKGARYAAAVSSGTAAVHMSLVALGIGSGDEVIVPTMTFCSTVHSIIHAGAVPVLVDCSRTTFNMDADAIEKKITPKTKAILIVHMCGRCCEMDPIMDIARKHGLRVIEDCAHAIESSYRDRRTGMMGDLGCFSFYPTKHITTGDGGMVITPHKELFDRIKLLSLHGMSASAWSRSRSGRCGYEVLEAGFKYNMTDIAASLGLGQLACLDERWKRREQIWLSYNRRLNRLPLTLPPPAASDTVHAYHLYTPLLDVQSLTVDRDRIITALSAENIGVGVHYVPVHEQPYYRRRFKFRPSDFPNASFVGQRTLSLPLSPDLSEDDLSCVCAALSRILEYYAARPPA